MPDRPNLLLVFADQMRGQDTGYAGNGDVRTPHLDRLAGEGCWFDLAFTNAPVCTPARGTLLTGLHPHRHGALLNDLPLRTDVPTLGTRLRDQGYATGYVGKWHLDGVPRDRFTPPGPRRGGFDHWTVHNCSHDYVHGFCYRGESEARVPVGPYDATFFADEAVRFLSQHRGDPFALVVSWGPPHNPYRTAPARFQSQYQPSSLTLRPNVAEPCGAISQKEGPELRANLAGYYAHISALDHEMGRLLAALREFGLERNTVVVFTSDHGDMLLSHGYSRKQLPFEESVRIPLIFQWPGHLYGHGLRRGLFGLVDLMPTLCSLLGAGPTPGGVDGRDLSASVLAGDASPLDSVLIYNQGAVDEAQMQGVGEWVGVRTGRYTYVRHLDGRPWLCYDDVADPWQQHNLLGAVGVAPVQAALESFLDREIAAAGLPLTPWPATLRNLGLAERWNERERHMHPAQPRLLE